MPDGGEASFDDPEDFTCLDEVTCQDDLCDIANNQINNDARKEDSFPLLEVIGCRVTADPAIITEDVQDTVQVSSLNEDALDLKEDADDCTGVRTSPLPFVEQSEGTAVEQDRSSEVCGQEETDDEAVNSADLLGFAWQIARGMVRTLNCCLHSHSLFYIHL